MTTDPLKEALTKNRDLKARNSDLSRELDLSRRDVKTWQDASAAVPVLEEKIADLEADLVDANRQIAELTKAKADADVAATKIQEQADALVAIRTALKTP